MATGVNPYSEAETNAGEAPDPTSRYRPSGSFRYAVPSPPDSSDPDYTLGFSSELENGGSPDGKALPSDIRIGTREEPENDPNNKAYTSRRYADQNFQYNQQEMTSTGWKVQQQKVPAGQNPMWTQERLPVRLTADSSPMGTFFKRYWHIPRNIKDALGPDAVTHFSMADHRRAYEIMGQKPQGRLGVNTYRASPRPWDESLYVVPEDQNIAGGNNGSYAGNRAHRLV